MSSLKSFIFHSLDIDDRNWKLILIDFWIGIKLWHLTKEKSKRFWKVLFKKRTRQIPTGPFCVRLNRGFCLPPLIFTLACICSLIPRNKVCKIFKLNLRIALFCAPGNFSALEKTQDHVRLEAIFRVQYLKKYNTSRPKWLKSTSWYHNFHYWPMKMGGFGAPGNLYM